eukprot:UN29222
MEKRGRLYDVINRNLSKHGEDVLISATNAASGWHSDSTARDYNPQCVGLLCVQKAIVKNLDGSKGGVLTVVNSINAYNT